MTPECPTGKVGYRTESQAHRASRRIREKGSVRAHSYHCDKCHAWHVGGFRAAHPAPAAAFAKPEREIPDTPPGTRHCQDCGHPLDVHALGRCLGRRGRCACGQVSA